LKSFCMGSFAFVRLFREPNLHDMLPRHQVIILVFRTLADAKKLINICLKKICFYTTIIKEAYKKPTNAIISVVFYHTYAGYL